MTSEFKVCPFCAEEIQKAAIKCKHCGSDLLLSDTPKLIMKIPTSLITGDSFPASGYVNIMDTRLIFEPRLITLKKVYVNIEYQNINDVAKFNKLLFIPQGILIRTSTGVTYHFHMSPFESNRDKAIEIIKSKAK